MLKVILEIVGSRSGGVSLPTGDIKFISNWGHWNAVLGHHQLIPPSVVFVHVDTHINMKNMILLCSIGNLLQWLLAKIYIWVNIKQQYRYLASISDQNKTYQTSIDTPSFFWILFLCVLLSILPTYVKLKCNYVNSIILHVQANLTNYWLLLQLTVWTHLYCKTTR